MHKPSNGTMGVFRVLVCRVQSRLCGLPLDAVEETLRPQPLRPLASPPVHVQGLARIRGDWVPVVDLTGLLGLEPVAPRRYVVVRAGERRVALAVTEVLGLQALPPGTVRDLPPLLRDRAHGAIAALAERDDDLIAVLDQARLLPAETLASVASLNSLSSLNSLASPASLPDAVGSAMDETGRAEPSGGATSPPRAGAGS